MGYAAEHDMRHGVNLRFHRSRSIAGGYNHEWPPTVRTHPNQAFARGERTSLQPSARSTGYTGSGEVMEVRMPNMAFIEGQTSVVIIDSVNQIKRFRLHCAHHIKTNNIF